MCIFFPLKLVKHIPYRENIKFLIEWQAFIQETFLSAPDEQQNLEMIYILYDGKAISMSFFLCTLFCFLSFTLQGHYNKYTSNFVERF